MAVFKNYYNRKSQWAMAVSCLFLLCSTISCTIGSTERMRHHHPKLGSYGDGADPIPGCPNCLYENQFAKERSETDRLRLEAIKKQILQKLGLRHKPNVTHSLPRDVVWQTLERADDESDFSLNGYGDFSTTSARSSTDEVVEVDDFYGRTSEIISFAEKGSKVNHNRLLEFRASAAVQQDSDQVGQEFKVRSAALWLKADLLPDHLRRNKVKCRSTDVFVFKIISNRIPESVVLSSRQFDRLTAEPVSIPLEEHRPGWQKIDLTPLVRQWLSEPNAADRLRLFVDCGCCSRWRVHLLNDVGDDERPPPNDPDRPFLVVRVEPGAARRVRKRAIDCTGDTGDQCCKQRFYVSFRDLGWDDWVIAPQGYHANYCRGECGHPRTPDTYVTYHTHVMEEARKTHHLAGMTACCAPLKFSSMSLIYYGPDSTIIKRDLPKMIVDECGCP